jgi:hypothetical protein
MGCTLYVDDFTPEVFKWYRDEGIAVCCSKCGRLYDIGDVARAAYSAMKADTYNIKLQPRSGSLQ